MAMNGRGRLAVIERGRESIPGTFGDTLRGGSPASLVFSFSAPTKYIEILSAGQRDAERGNQCAERERTGRLSLINANVAIRPDRECFTEKNWPFPFA